MVSIVSGKISQLYTSMCVHDGIHCQSVQGKLIMTYITNYVVIE